MAEHNGRPPTGAIYLTLAVLIAGGLIGYMNVRRLDDNRRLVSRTHEVAESLETLLSTLKDAETGQRGYLLSGTTEYLEPYQAALSGLSAERQHLAALISDNPAQVIALSGLNTRIDAKLDELAQTIGLMKRGDKPGALAIVNAGSGKATMDGVRRDVAGMKRAEMDLAQSRDRETIASYRAAVASIALATFVGVLLTGLVLYGFRRNLTQAQIAARLLAEEEERLRTTLASIGDAVISTDADANVTFLNPVAEALTAWTNADAAGQPLSQVFNIVNESSRLAVENPAIRALRDGVIVGLANHTILIAKDGTEWPIDDSAAPIRSADGSVAGCVLVFRDISGRKKDEEALQRMAANLADADRRKDEFLATLAHELRNPLAPIRTGLQLLHRMRPSHGPGQKEDDYIRRMIERQTDHLVRLVDDLMDVSRITRGVLELRKKRVDLAAVLRDAVEAARPIIESKGHQLTLTLPPTPMFVDADTTRLGQVFTNLLNNAAKYSERDGRIWLAAERRDSTLVISVKDTGIGIPSDMLPKIFEMFAQVDRSLERSQGGLGIGLTLAKRLAEMHGGALEAHSDGPGQGSEFVVRLPAALAPV